MEELDRSRGVDRRICNLRDIFLVWMAWPEYHRGKEMLEEGG